MSAGLLPGLQNRIVAASFQDIDGRNEQGSAISSGSGV